MLDRRKFLLLESMNVSDFRNPQIRITGILSTVCFLIDRKQVLNQISYPLPFACVG